MVTESGLIQKRQEVRDEILALKETIPSARILNLLGKAFKHNSLGYWLSNIVLLNLILLSPWALIGLALREFQRAIPVFVGGIIATESLVLGIVIAHIAVQYTLDDIANRIVEKISNINDLSKLLLWLKQTWSLQDVSAIAVPFCLLWVLLGVASVSFPYHQFVGFGFALTTILVGLLVGLVSHVYIWTCLLVSSLKVYQYDMNTFSPADSEIINDISEMLTRSIYILATYEAVVTLVGTSSLIDEQTRAIIDVPFFVIGWTVIIIQFLVTRSTLGAITNRAKWKTLNRIREKINALEATGDLSDKDTAERLFRLADIHKQIMASKTNTLDLKSVSTLFSQLMLPLLGLLLGNIDKLSKFLP